MVHSLLINSLRRGRKHLLQSPFRNIYAMQQSTVRPRHQSCSPLKRVTKKYIKMQNITVYRGKALVRHEWACSTGVLPRPHRKMA